jgi:hypothetical protein
LGGKSTVRGNVRAVPGPPLAGEAHSGRFMRGAAQGWEKNLKPIQRSAEEEQWTLPLNSRDPSVAFAEPFNLTAEFRFPPDPQGSRDDHITSLLAAAAAHRKPHAQQVKEVRWPEFGVSQLGRIAKGAIHGQSVSRIDRELNEPVFRTLNDRSDVGIHPGNGCFNLARKYSLRRVRLPGQSSELPMMA